ncbi:tyrosine-type recombinase/integrase [Streptomyces sp. MUSC 125]|uniref:tyrosine-type recombinase/integrase n=1 Tax=Streptomyces sp. MUSC 125 TaxID=1428624 RepID=UPI001F481B3E|nr:site-specific integrase [Streptomyces sp. MUSC 125]
MTRKGSRRANSVRLAGTKPAPAQALFIDHDLQADEARVGPHDRLTRAEVLALLPASPLWPPGETKASRDRANKRLANAAKILDWLEKHPGHGWQERWRAAGADRGKEVVLTAVLGDHQTDGQRDGVIAGLNCLMLSRIVLPGYGFLRGYKALLLFKQVQQMFPAGDLDTIRDHGAGLGMTPRHVDEGLRLISSMILHTGRDLHELTAEDVFQVRARGRRMQGEAFVGTHSAWELLRGVGAIQSKDTLKDALRHGQRPTTELVDSYNIQSTEIRNVLVRYLDERRPGVDYGTFRGLVRELAGVFWADIEAHHPGINSLRLPDDVIDGWKQRIVTYVHARSGEVKERRSRIDVMMRVRGFYLDIQEWAHEDPFWAQWAVPSPITRGDGAGNQKIYKQTTARMHQRVRDRLPHLPVLVQTAERVHREAADLLDAARATPFDEVFEHGGTSYVRELLKVNQVPSRLDHGSPHVFIRTVGSTGRRINQSLVEDDAFWSWAVIETLRHTGVRAEELTELTHLALVSYRLPETGEVVPLLQIVPSKSNEERLLLVSPELASVLATIIKRLRDANSGKIPLIARYDSHERVTGPMLPHLFQRRPYWQPQVMSEAAVKHRLDRTLEATGLRDQAGQPLNYTPHDFRRMFATEAVTGGLPVHIAARILGHKTLTTTQAYLAVFQDDLVRTYRGFLDRRRADRPQDEYREPTEREWHDFQQHFELRKVSLGTCGRPYGTPCQHEHACIRCPVLQLDPEQRPRLIEIIRNLRERITEARANGWLGEVEGLQVSLNAAMVKLTNLSRATTDGRPQLVDLGMPIFTDLPRQGSKPLDDREFS